MPSTHLSFVSPLTLWIPIHTAFPAYWISFFFFFSHLEQLFSVSFCFVLFLPFSVKEVGITLHKGAPSLVRLIASRRF